MKKKINVASISDFEILVFGSFIDFEVLYIRGKNKCPFLLNISYEVKYDESLDKLLGYRNRIRIRDKLSSISININRKGPHTSDSFNFNFEYYLGMAVIDCYELKPTKYLERTLISRKKADRMFQQIIHIIQNIPNSLEYFSEFYKRLIRDCNTFHRLSFLIDSFRDTFKEIVGEEYLLYLEATNL